MKQKYPADPYQFDGQLGEAVLIKISPIGVGNTFVASKPAELESGGKPNSKNTLYKYDLEGDDTEGQIIRMMFRFPVATPDSGFTPAGWPRFEISVAEDKEDGREFQLPAVLQSSTAPAPSEQIVDLFFFVVA